MSLTLREYLRQQSQPSKEVVCIEEYDKFLIQVWDFFSLRAAAERYYKGHRHVAYSRSGALPVSWEILRKTWRTDGPPEQPITVIANRHGPDITEILGHLRRVLRRETQKVPLGRVQQVDAHCLRWLVRQPGRTAIEKGGMRQEILGVVRVVSCDTLENRVLKDFLRRCIAQATLYLRRYESRYPDHANVKAVRRFRNVCRGGLAKAELSQVRDIRDFPQPNYVLQQDRLYSKIWTSYCEVLQQEDVAERLWNREREIDELYSRCESRMELHCSKRAKYATPLWINRIDGIAPVFENPIWENELGSKEIDEPQASGAPEVTIDFTKPWGGRCELVYPAKHRNARPFLQNPCRPSLEPGESVTVEEICENGDSKRWSDYLRALHGLVGGKRWVVLSPDHWDARKLELVARALPPMMPRTGVFFLWRSVAVALGLMESGQVFEDGASLVVVDGYSSSAFNGIEIRFRRDDESGEIVPQRASARLHDLGVRGCVDPRFCLRHSHVDPDVLSRLGDETSMQMGVGNVFWSLRDEDGNDISFEAPCGALEKGVSRYVRRSNDGKISYFDEREALSLVVQTRAEEVVFATLVEHEECSPGGRVYRGGRVRGGFLPVGADSMSLYLLEGVERDDVGLKSLETRLEEPLTQETNIFFAATLTPGQGLAHVEVSSEVLPRSLQLDLTEMKDSGKTKAGIERGLKRHFPPVMPLVEACDEMWDVVRPDVRCFMKDEIPPPSDLFAKAQPYWGRVDPTGKSSHRRFGEDRFFNEDRQSPIDRLKRENVFGNAPGHRYPRIDGFAWTELFTSLAVSYCQSPKKFLRLIAWSYQFDAPCFEFMREEFYERYVNKKESLSTMEITFCSNNFDAKDERVSSLTREVLTRIGHGDYSQEELRLAYNLMQFYPLALSDVSTAICNDAMTRLMSDYQKEYEGSWFKGWGWAGKEATKAAGYYLKCMLFLLHRRRTDAEFYKQPENWNPPSPLNQPLPGTTPTLRLHEGTRKAFIQYVRGQGTIDGIPMGDS